MKRSKMLIELNMRLNTNDNTTMICSGCKKPNSTVDRYMFDGLCADCTDRALYDDDFAKKAKDTNSDLIENEY